MPMTEGGGFIQAIPNADLLAPITQCECKWGQNDCPNPPAMIVMCWDVKGFTVCCDAHVMNFARHVDPCDGSYFYMTPHQFNQAKIHGLYTFHETWRSYWYAVLRTTSTYHDAVLYGIFPPEEPRG